MFDGIPPSPAGRDDGAVDAMLEEVFRQSRSHAEIPGMEFKARLLASYDEHRRRARNRFSSALFADAFGWRALARPLAAAGVLSGVCAAGYVAGAAASPGGVQTYAEFAAEFGQSFDLAEEDSAWAEE